jgi:hypothetical protein
MDKVIQVGDGGCTVDGFSSEGNAEHYARVLEVTVPLMVHGEYSLPHNVVSSEDGFRLEFTMDMSFLEKLEKAVGEAPVLSSFNLFPSPLEFARNDDADYYDAFQGQPGLA